MNKEVLNNITVIVPSLNPDEKLMNTINSLLSVGFTDIVCINDGSCEECLGNFPNTNENITILVHEVNRGKGAALKTAFKYIKENRPNSIGAITVDGDGQHAAPDVLGCAEEMVNLGDRIILGCRDFSLPQVPKKSRYGNRITSGVFKLLCGMKISDTQTGLRAFPAKYYDDMLQVFGDRFEYETNMLLEMKARKIPFSEVKIETVYIEENKTSHFRPFKDSFRIYSLILKFSFGQFFKFFISSVLSFLIDGILMFLLLTVFNAVFGIFESTLLAAIITGASKLIARVFSSLFNFFVNRKMVFASEASLKTSLVRYYALAVPIAVVSVCATSLFEALFFFDTAILVTLLGYAVDIVLFIVSYTFQKKWVFKK